jgi:tetratricopeptide (TPR) repeat protein
MYTHVLPNHLRRLGQCICLLIGSCCLAIAVNAQSKSIVTNAPLQSAKLLFADAQYAEAIQAARAVADKDSMSFDAVRIVGLSLQALGDYSSAAVCLERATKLDSTSVPVLRSLAQCYRILGDVSRTIAAFDRAVRYDSTNPITLHQYATFLVESENFDKAAMLWERIVVKEPRNPLLRIQLARTYSRSPSTNANALASANYLLALDLLPRNLPLRLEAATAMFDAGNMLGTLTVSERGVMLFPTEPKLWRKSASAHNRLNHFREAVYAYRQCLTLGDSAVPVLRELGVMYCRLKQFDSARIYLEFAANGMSSEIDTRITSFLALAERELGNFEKSIQWNQITLQGLKRSQISSVIGQIGLTYRKAEFPEKALEYYRLSLGLDSASLDARFEIATLYDGASSSSSTQSLIGMKSDAKTTTQARQMAILYFKQFLMRVRDKNAPTTLYAIQRLGELNEKLPPMLNLQAPQSSSRSIAQDSIKSDSFGKRTTLETSATIQLDSTNQHSDTTHSNE